MGRTLSHQGKHSHTFRLVSVTLSTVCWKQVSFLVNITVIHVNCFLWNGLRLTQTVVLSPF